MVIDYPFAFKPDLYAFYTYNLETTTDYDFEIVEPGKLTSALRSTESNAAGIIQNLTPFQPPLHGELVLFESEQLLAKNAKLYTNCALLWDFLRGPPTEQAVIVFAATTRVTLALVKLHSPQARVIGQSVCHPDNLMEFLKTNDIKV